MNTRLARTLIAALVAGLFAPVAGAESNAELLKKIVRPTDVCVRIGGEEMLVVLPSTGLEGARVVAERVRAAVRELSIDSVQRSSSMRTSTVTGSPSTSSGCSKTRGRCSHAFCPRTSRRNPPTRDCQRRQCPPRQRSGMTPINKATKRRWLFNTCGYSGRPKELPCRSPIA